MARLVLAAMAALWIWVVPATASDATDRQQIIAAINDLIEAFETRDADGIKAMMTSDHVAISPNYGRPYSVDEQIATLGELEFDVVDFGERTISMIDDNVALVTQRSTVKGRFRGEDLPREIFVSQLWVREGGRWLQRLYQETAVGQ